MKEYDWIITYICGGYYALPLSGNAEAQYYGFSTHNKLEPLYINNSKYRQMLDKYSCLVNIAPNTRSITMEEFKDIMGHNCSIIIYGVVDKHDKLMPYNVYSIEVNKAILKIDEKTELTQEAYKYINDVYSAIVSARTLGDRPNNIIYTSDYTSWLAVMEDSIINLIEDGAKSIRYTAKTTIFGDVTYVHLEECDIKHKYMKEDITIEERSKITDEIHKAPDVAAVYGYYVENHDYKVLKR